MAPSGGSNGSVTGPSVLMTAGTILAIMMSVGGMVFSALNPRGDIAELKTEINARLKELDKRVNDLDAKFVSIPEHKEFVKRVDGEKSEYQRRLGILEADTTSRGKMADYKDAADKQFALVEKRVDRLEQDTQSIATPKDILQQMQHQIDDLRSRVWTKPQP